MMSLLAGMPRLAPRAGRPVLAAALVCASAAAACGGADDPDRADRLDRDIRAAAGVTSLALAHDDILPDVEVTGPRFLPGLDEAGVVDAGPPWGLVRATEARKAVFMSALTGVCTPAPPPETEAAVDARDDAAADPRRDADPDPGQDAATRTGAGVGDPLRAAYPGRTTLNTLSDPAPFEGAVLRMVLDDCDGDLLPIPFLVGDDASRTWLLQFQEDGLRLAHDHREPDGTPSEANLYGGVAHVPAGEADETGGHPTGTDETILYFPADERTLEDRPGRVANVWAMALDSERELFFYRLYLNGELRLEAAFDLTVTVAVEAPD
jgi:hypothetical protein